MKTITVKYGKKTEQDRPDRFIVRVSVGDRKLTCVAATKNGAIDGLRDILKIIIAD